LNSGSMCTIARNVHTEVRKEPEDAT
jgi:hypothetical protein